MDADEESTDSELFIHILSCLTLNLLIKVYLAEEDQHELYFLRKRLEESRLDKQALQEGIFEYGEFSNVFFSINEKSVYKKYFEKYKDKVHQLTQFIKIFKPDLVSIDIDTRENGEQYECKLNRNLNPSKF